MPIEIVPKKKPKPTGAIGSAVSGALGSAVSGAIGNPGVKAREKRAKTHSNRRLPRPVQRTLDKIRMGKNLPKGPA